MMLAGLHIQNGTALYLQKRYNYIKRYEITRSMLVAKATTGVLFE